MSIEVSRDNLSAKLEEAKKEVKMAGNRLRKHIMRQESDREEVDDSCKDGAEELIIAFVRRDRFIEMDHQLEVIQKDLEEEDREIPYQLNSDDVEILLAEAESFTNFDTHEEYEGLNMHREAFMRYMQKVGYQRSRFKRPIFNCVPEYKD